MKKIDLRTWKIPHFFTPIPALIIFISPVMDKAFSYRFEIQLWWLIWCATVRFCRKEM